MQQHQKAQVYTGSNQNTYGRFMKNRDILGDFMTCILFQIVPGGDLGYDPLGSILRSRSFVLYRLGSISISWINLCILYRLMSTVILFEI